jgi:diguanylate cyclase (GGDEF)-like protein/PAS domain S-box-containing protein
VRGTWNGRTALFCASRDLSDLALSEEKFEKAFMTNATLMAITDPETGRFIDINTSFLRVLGQDATAVIGRTLVDLGIVPDEPTRRSLDRELQSPDRVEPREVRFVTASGDPFVGELSAQRITSGPHDHLLLMISDVTSQRTLMDELEHQATHDPLTGAFNRVVTDRILAHEARRAERVGTPVSLMIADIDLFKAINDHFGHPVGDAVLKEVVARMTDRIRETDLLARWGGEEFLVILPGTDAAGARQLAETLCAAVAEAPIPPVGTVTVSIGVAAFHPGEAVEPWIARADEALYDAKEAGRNRVCGAEIQTTGEARGPLVWEAAPIIVPPRSQSAAR